MEMHVQHCYAQWALACLSSQENYILQELPANGKASFIVWPEGKRIGYVVTWKQYHFPIDEVVASDSSDVDVL